MNENLDLTKILDGCPEGTKFYHSTFGDVRFEEINKESEYPIKVSLSDNYRASVTSEGLHYKEYDGECILFPSKEQRDWSKFERFWDNPKVKKFDLKTLQPFDKILVRRDIDCCWTPRFFGYIDGSTQIPRDINGSLCALSIPYNNETEHLVGTTTDCPEYYKWWED